AFSRLRSTQGQSRTPETDSVTGATRVRAAGNGALLSRRIAHGKMPTREGAGAMAKVRVGLVGCGFAAELHMHAYRRVYGIDVEVAAVAARGDHVVDFAKRHRIRT